MSIGGGGVLIGPGGQGSNQPPPGGPQEDPYHALKPGDGEVLEVRFHSSLGVMLVYPDRGINAMPGLLTSPLIYFKGVNPLEDNPYQNTEDKEKYLWKIISYHAFGLPFELRIVKEPIWWKNREKMAKLYPAK